MYEPNYVLAYMYIDTYTCMHAHTYQSAYMYMKIHVPRMLANGVETINKQTQQTSSHYDMYVCMYVLGMGRRLQNNIQSFVSKNERIFEGSQVFLLIFYRCCSKLDWLYNVFKTGLLLYKEY